MCYTFKHLFICNTFCCWLIMLSLYLYIELALVCCTNPDNVNCFGTMFPNLNFVFASIWAARPVHIESDQYRSCSTVKPLKDPLSVLLHPPRLGSNLNSAVALGSLNNMMSIQPEECADEWRQNNADLKLLENCVMNGFIIFGIMFMTATGLENSPQSFGVYTVSQSRSVVDWVPAPAASHVVRPRNQSSSVVTSAENPAPDNSPQSIGELRNGRVANLQELYYTRLVRKMAWYKILIHVLIV